MKITGSLEVDARNVPCPRCGERSGSPCFTPSGAISSSTHAGRYELLFRLYNPRLWHVNGVADHVRMPLDLEV
jgi:hypothetical protein